VQAGVYDGNPDRFGDGTRINLHEEEGALAYFEAGYRLNSATGDTGLPGNYKVGAWYHTDDFFDMETTLMSMVTGQTPEMHSGDWGVYLLVDQTLYRENEPDQDPCSSGVGPGFSGWLTPSRSKT
jgi:porin